MPRHPPLRFASRVAAITATALAAFASPAAAGEYGVIACDPGSIDVNASWFGATTAGMAAYATCPPPAGESRDWNQGLVTRHAINANSNATVPFFSYGWLGFRAPPGAGLSRMRYSHSFCGMGGFRAGLFTAAGGPLHVSERGCGTFVPSPFTLQLHGIPEVRLLTICSEARCSVGSTLRGWATIRSVTVYIEDNTTPSVWLAGGSITGGGWKRGVLTADVGWSDNVGVAEAEFFLGGQQVNQRRGACDPALVVPCSTPASGISLDTRVAADGEQELASRVRDSAGNWGEHRTSVFIDNHAPTSPRLLKVEGGESWRAMNDFAVSWTNPPQTGTAPIAAVGYAVCPASTQPDRLDGCVRTGLRDPDIGAAKLRVPGTGEWVARVWLADAAGNEEPKSASEVRLRFDDVPPTLVIANPDPQDPQRVSVIASDADSGVSRGELEIRRQGETKWLSLPVETTATGLTAIIDDAALPGGIYDLRARVFDAAGNERSTSARASGVAAQLSLPLRVPTHLTAGSVSIRRGPDGRRRKVLMRTATARYGVPVVVRGRLTTRGGNPLGNTDVEFFERTALPDQQWVRSGITKTGPRGWFRYRILRGPSRTVLVRYHGTLLIRPDSAEVELRVRAKTSLDVNRRRVVNGDEIVFRGRVRGGPVPGSGKLLQLQAYSRGIWRTFATPRASARSHRWHCRYRFTATRGSVRYRFRAVVPKEAGFPFERGTSRRLSVFVQGL
jgi:hypothetical protein